LALDKSSQANSRHRVTGCGEKCGEVSPDPLTPFGPRVGQTSLGPRVPGRRLA
jgi:hypothetical protein